MARSTKIILAVVVLLVLIQLYPVDKSIPKYDTSQGFLQVYDPPEDVKQILQNACFDCHSYQTQWPWYSRIAPVSWIIKHHVSEGRDYFNFDTWGQLTPKKQRHITEEMYDEIEEREMPLTGYVWMHKEADLSASERARLLNWLKTL